MSTQDLQDGRLRHHIFKSADEEMRRVISEAIEAQTQFQALHDGKRWTVTVVVPRQPVENDDPESEKEIA